MKRRALCLITAACLLLSCGKSERAELLDAPGAYTIVDSELMTPGGFADYAYDGSDPTWGKFYQVYLNSLNAALKVKNLLLGAAMAVEAGHSGADWGYRKYIINYTSTDAQGKPVKLSEVVIVPTGIGWNHRPSKIFLCSHYTIFADYERSTGEFADYLTGTAASDAVFICPDQEGYGASVDHIHPCLANMQIARQLVDGTFAALKLLEDEGIKMKKDFRLYNGGYSLGASYALAVHKYIETVCTPEEREQLHLEASYCGGGPYSPLYTFQWYTEQETVYYTCVLPMLIDGMVYSYPEFFDGIRTEDYFTQEFLDAGVLEMVRSKEYSSAYLRPYIKEKVGDRVDAILSEEALTPGSTIRAALEKALAECDLTEGWAPVRPVILYHTENDQYVPYENAELAVKGLVPGNIKLKKLLNVMPDDPHNGGGVIYYLKYIIGGV